jgi:hypothetical protein
MRSLKRSSLAFVLLAVTLAVLPARGEEGESSSASSNLVAEKASSVDEALSEYAAPKEGKKPTYRVRTYRASVKKTYARKATPQR